jgi:hypothetical protein
MHYLDYEFNKKLNYHKCINDNKQRYIIFPDRQEILIDPWELIAKHYPSDLKKLQETAGAHVFFNVVYNMQNFNNLFQMTRHLILRVMEFYGLNDPFQITSGLNSAASRQTTGSSWSDRNRFCIKCGTPIKFTNNSDIFLTCSEKCFDNFAKQSNHVSLADIPKLTAKSKQIYKEHHKKIIGAIVKLIKKCQINSNAKPKDGYSPTKLDPETQNFLEDKLNITGIIKRFIKNSKSDHKTFSTVIDGSRNDLLIEFYDAFKSQRESLKAGEYSWGKFLLNRDLIKNYFN